VLSDLPLPFTSTKPGKKLIHKLSPQPAAEFNTISRTTASQNHLLALKGQVFGRLQQKKQIPPAFTDHASREKRKRNQADEVPECHFLSPDT
jgi:hypothetical protein